MELTARRKRMLIFLRYCSFLCENKVCSPHTCVRNT
jgi:hypothetical protein